ncbi:MAG: hypothetical protein C4586_08695 [Anaerolineaceae bacterium]|nr:MAG: hypothetical protein C4586_08695 [Anaerolineaceae bacterium]
MLWLEFVMFIGILSLRDRGYVTHTHAIILFLIIAADVGTLRHIAQIDFNAALTCRSEAEASVERPG